MYDIWPPRYSISSKYTRYLKACMRAEQMKLYDSPVYTTQNACKSESC